MTLAGYVMFALRHKTWLSGDIAEIERRIHALETPLARALRRLEHTFEKAA